MLLLNLGARSHVGRLQILHAQRVYCSILALPLTLIISLSDITQICLAALYAQKSLHPAIFFVHSCVSWADSSYRK